VRVWPLVLLIALVFPASALASLNLSLQRQMRAAGRYSSAYVVDADSGRTLYSSRPDTARILASNTKLFTTSTALARFGPDATFPTQVLANAPIGPDGVLKGDMWLKGDGDPAFGTLAFVRKYYGPQAGSVEALVDSLASLGLTAVRGGIHGDESVFDSVRGVHDSGYRTSPWVGPLSALTINHGSDGTRFQTDPPSYARDVFRKTLKSDGITPGHAAGDSPAPVGATVLASVASPPLSTLVKLTNKDSDNFFAETLLKDIGVKMSGLGTTAAGVQAVQAYARSLGVSVHLLDGSGLDHSDRASARSVVKLLLAERQRPEFPALYGSLPIAGVDGSVHDRMRSGPARRNCRAKTGSLIGVSALSGFCTTRSGHTVAFSFLMNGVSVSYARRLQDSMTQAIAGWTG
jgi:serine-type D-Ala-D-Ala carboxypeptidase/endopeptidase (penicillin-binding protein 4)